MQLARLVLWLHVTSNVVWIGSILAVAGILVAESGDPNVRGEIGLRVYRRLATPAFASSLVAGVSRLAMTYERYFVATKFMHAKLLLAVVVIAMHHLIGGRAKRMAAGSRPDAGPTRLVAGALLLAAVATTYFAVLKPF